jgi:hypothetical protein
MATDGVPTFASKEEAWREHNLSQLRYFRSLSLREKFLAIEGMADVVRRLEEARARLDQNRRGATVLNEDK